MILTDARRTRIDHGPANGRGENSVRIANVEYGDHHAYAVLALKVSCPMCDGPMPIGRLTCSLRCSRARYDRMGVG